MCANKTVVECAKLRLLVTPASIHPTNGADTIYRPLQRMFKHDSLSRTLIFHQSKSWSPQIPFQNYIVVCILQAMRYALRWSYQRLQNWWENLEVSLWIPVQCWAGHNFCQTSYRGICVSFLLFFYQVQLHKWPRKLQLRRWTESRKSEIGDTSVQRWYYRL